MKFVVAMKPTEAEQKTTETKTEMEKTIKALQNFERRNPGFNWQTDTFLTSPEDHEE